MGGAISAIFGGGQSAPSAPVVQAPEPEEPITIREEEKEAASKAARDEEQRKLKSRRAMGGTLLTAPLGQSGGVGGIMGRAL